MRPVPEHAYPERLGGARVHAPFDPRRRREGRFFPVQYRRFAVQGRAPVAASVDLPGLAHHAALTAEQGQALAEGLERDATR